MAKIYFEKLSDLISKLETGDASKKLLEVKHFFSGAALYTNKAICMSWSPVGLAFKLPENEVEKLINSGEAIPLKYFPDSPIKSGYALFENPDTKKLFHWRKYFKMAINSL